MVWISFDEHIFKHPWEKVVEAAIRKYPNPETPNVCSTDIVERKIDDEGRLCSTRLISSVWAGSTMQTIARFTGIGALLNQIHAFEFSTVDVQKKKYELTSRNYSLMDYIVIDERLTYTAHPTIPDTTTLKQEWHITVKKLSFTSFLERVTGTSMKSMAVKGRAGIEYVIGQLQQEVDTVQKLARKIEENITVEVDSMQKLARKIEENIQVDVDTVQKFARKIEENLNEEVDSMHKFARKLEENLNITNQEEQHLSASVITESDST